MYAWTISTNNLSQEQRENVGNYNFDHPDSLDFDDMYECIKELLDYKDVMIPDYDFSTHSRKAEKIPVKSSHFILFEGILALYDERIRDMMDIKIYVTEDNDTRLLRRIKRDIRERGRTLENVLLQWHKTVKPSFDEFVAGTLKHADIIVNGNQNNKKAVNFICFNLKSILKEYIEFYQQSKKDIGAVSEKEVIQEEET